MFRRVRIIANGCGTRFSLNVLYAIPVELFSEIASYAATM
jgi:hypothetical protein